MIKKLLKKFKKIIKSKNGKREFVLESIPKSTICAEIGTYKGDFSQKILLTAKPKELHLIDPWLYESGEQYKTAWYGGAARSQDAMDAIYGNVSKRFEREIESGTVFIHRETSEEACQYFPDNYFDWIYIDGNHLYEFVKKDLKLYYSKVKDGGIIAGDDYTKGGWWKGGVKKAVDEFIAKGKVKKIKIYNHQFILRKL